MIDLICHGRFSWQIECAGGADCTVATFEDGLDIADSQFAGLATFHNAILGDRTNLDRVRFAGVNLRALRLPAEFDPMLLEASVGKNHILLPDQLEPVSINKDPMRWYIRRATSHP